MFLKIMLKMGYVLHCIVTENRNDFTGGETM